MEALIHTAEGKLFDPFLTPGSVFICEKKGSINFGATVTITEETVKKTKSFRKNQGYGEYVYYRGPSGNDFYCHIKHLRLANAQAHT